MTLAAIIGKPGTGGWEQVMVVARAQGQFHERHRVIIPRGPPVKLQRFLICDWACFRAHRPATAFVSQFG